MPDKQTEHTNQYYAALIRGTVANSNIVNIEIPELPPDCFFFTANNIQGKNKFLINHQKVELFAAKSIVYYGQPVGMLVAKDLETLNALKSQFIVHTDPISVKEEKPAIKKTFGKVIDVENAFVCSFSRMHFKPQHQYRYRTPQVFVQYDNTHLIVKTESNYEHGIVRAVSLATGIPEKKILLVAEETDTTDLWFSALLSCYAAIAASILKKNVAIKFSEFESIYFTPKTPAITITHKTHLKKDFSFADMHIDIQIDAGVFYPLIETHLNHLALTINSIYYFPNLYLNITINQNTCVLSDFSNNLGDSYITNALEKHINDIAHSFNLNAAEFRLNNIISSTQNHIFESLEYKNEFEVLFDKAVTITDFHRKHAANSLLAQTLEPDQKESRRGIALVAGLQYATLQSFPEQALTYHVRITAEIDNKLYVEMDASSDILQKTVVNIIAQELEAEPEAIVFKDPARSERPVITSPSISMAIIPVLVKRCCQQIKNQRFRMPLPISVLRSYRKRKSETQEAIKIKKTPFLSVTPAVCIIEVEVNISTFETNIKNILLLAAIGNTNLARKIQSTCEKNIAEKLSNLSCEKINIYAICENPVDISEYAFLPASKMPKININLVKDAAIQKSIYELAENLIGGAFISAINQVASCSQHPLELLPFYTDELFMAFNPIFMEDAEYDS